MSTKFLIGVNTSEEILSNPPPQFQHLNLIYAPFAVRVGRQDYPASFWCDFAGVWLFKWCRAVWKLSRHEVRSARLPFWYTYEVWLRQTPKRWWKVSLVKRDTATKTIVEESLVIPERVEAALLTASQKLLKGVRRVGVWTEDCEALEQFLNDPEGYWAALDSGEIQPPSFVTGNLGAPSNPGNVFMQNPIRPSLGPRQQFRPAPPAEALPRPIAHQWSSPPFFCPKCSAVLKPWEPGVVEQTCPACCHRIALP